MEKTLDKFDLINNENERVIANILHDIKSPLYSIKIALQTKLDNELNRDIYETASEIIKYIENFLSDYNFKTGKYEIEPVECDVREIINKKIENYKYLFMNKNIHISVLDEAGKTYKIKTVKAFLSSIIGNIISNIAFHAEENQEAIIKLEKRKDCVFINFQNSYLNQEKNFSLGLEFCEKLSKIIKTDLKFNKTKNSVKVDLKVPYLI